MGVTAKVYIRLTELGKFNEGKTVQGFSKAEDRNHIAIYVPSTQVVLANKGLNESLGFSNYSDSLIIYPASKTTGGCLGCHT